MRGRRLQRGGETLRQARHHRWVWQWRASQHEQLGAAPRDYLGVAASTWQIISPAPVHLTVPLLPTHLPAGAPAAPNCSRGLGRASPGTAAAAAALARSCAPHQERPARCQPCGTAPAPLPMGWREETCGQGRQQVGGTAKGLGGASGGSAGQAAGGGPPFSARPPAPQGPSTR